MINTATNYLKYANLQMAAEALFGQQGQPPGSIFSGKITIDNLTDGNKRSSRFTAVQAEEFSKDWAVVEHISNTQTGFSGTLFQCLKDDPSRGLVAGEQVISFRSTEFADDAARDNEATNVLEVKEYGWAFGQIADMEKWVARLNAERKIAAPATLKVTGYSLGGHLAAAYTLLHGAGSTYTFNGAGVGMVKGGDLKQVIATFEQQRNGAGLVFATQAAATRYAALKARLDPTITTADITNAQTDMGMSPEERALFSSALIRAKAVADEIARVAGISNSGAGGPPLQIGIANVDGARFAYQYAAVLAGQKTSSVRTAVPLSGWDAFAGPTPAANDATFQHRETAC